MIQLLLILLVFAILFSVFRAYTGNRNQPIWDPFGCNLRWVVKIEVENCEALGIIYKATYREWEKGDYVGKEVTVPVGRCEAKGRIAGIYVERIKTKKELEHDKLVEKWQ